MQTQKGLLQNESFAIVPLTVLWTPAEKRFICEVSPEEKIANGWLA